MRTPSVRALTRGGVVAALATSLVVGTPLVAQAAGTYPSDDAKPDLVSLLSGYDSYWRPSGTNDLHGTVLDASTLAHNDELTVWINRNASAAQRFTALQDSEYQDDASQYDQSYTVSQGLGDALEKIYVSGRRSGALPLTSALVNSQTGTSGAFVSTGAAKQHFSYPRPYLQASPTDAPVAGDEAACAPSTNANSSSVAPNRVGKPYASADGTLDVQRVPATTDTTHEFSDSDVTLDAGYGTSGICLGGSFPSGHTTTAYQAGITLATLVPELAPEILARASENGNDRIVLGVHYPIDIMGGRIAGEAALAARWSDAQYRTQVLEPARKELVSYLEAECGGTLAACIAAEHPYTNDPYDGKAMPGGTAQVVTDRASAVRVYQERMTYGFAATGATGLAPSVPAGADNLLLTTFPTLTDAQRTSVLAQTEIASGFPLDQSGSANGSWERLDLAAATSATVAVADDGSVRVVSTGGAARVVSGHLTAPDGTSVAAGGSLALAATGLPTGAGLRVVLRSDPVVVGTLTPAADGTATGSVTIPATTTPGAHTVDVVDASGASVLVAPLAVTVTPAATGTGSGGGSGTGAVDPTTGVHLPVVSGGPTPPHRRPVPPGTGRRRTTEERTMSRTSTWVTVAAVAAAVVAAAVVVPLVTTPGRPSAAATPSPTVGPTDVPVPEVPADRLAALPEVRYDAVVPGLLPLHRTIDHADVFHLRADAPLFGAARVTPVARFAARDFLRQPSTVVGVRREGPWELVLTPARAQLPSAAGAGGATAQTAAWTPAADLTTVASPTSRVVVSTRQQTVSVVGAHGAVEQRFTAGVGTADTPTPTGVTGYLEERYVDPSQGTGQHPIQLTSLHSSAADEPYGGHDGGLIGIHWNDTTSGAVSHGCVRLDAAAVAAIDALPLGTLVTVE